MQTTVIDRNSWPGAERREPRLDQPDYWTLHHMSVRLREVLATLALPAGSKTLDIGSGNQPYRPHFDEFQLDYLCTDEGDFRVTAMSRGERLPFAASSFDLVLSSQVLEHVTDPWRCVEEIHRILKPEGYLIFSVPFVWEVHNYPGDFWRFSEQGVRQLLKRFEILQMEGSTNSLQTILQALNLWIYRSFGDGFWRRAAIRSVNRWICGPARRSRDLLLPATYFCVARKK